MPSTEFGLMPTLTGETGATVVTALRFAGFTLDPAARTLVDAANQEISLRRSEFELLLAFTAAAGRALSRDHLLEAVAGRRSEPYDRSIDVLIGRLRRKLETDPKMPRLIITVPGVGYRFAITPRPVSAAEAAKAPSPAPAAPVAPERRQVTIVQCGLSGAALLAARRDPEDLQRLLIAFHSHCAAIIQGTGGIVARLPGQVLLAYFGYPRAREDAAEQAIRAARRLIETMDTLRTEHGGDVHMRIGIATGLMLVGDLLGDGSAEPAVLGEATDLAAGLLASTEAGMVVIDQTTRHLVGDTFQYREHTPIMLAGFAEPVCAWQVTGEGVESRFEALRGRAVADLVGREEDLSLLLRRWGQAKAGTGRVVLISGEPGIGKSRLVRAVQDRLASTAHQELRYFCSPHQRDNAFYPVITQMERAAGFTPADEPVTRFAKLQALLATTKTSLEDVALITELHGLPPGNLSPPLDLTPQRKRDKTFEALLRHIESLARQKPVLMIFDDIQWIDPSSRELLDRLIERLAGWPVLFLAMFRPEFQPPWIGQPHLTLLTLGRLDRHNTATMIANVVGDTTLPDETVAEITERTDGVPLFVEELTKVVLETGTLAPASLSGIAHAGLSVPPTLHASLMARLDRLGPAAREVAQAGAAIGREFSYSLLPAITDLAEPQLREALDRLSKAGLVSARGTPPDANYLFKHALVRDAAYGSLLRSRRQGLHRRIVATLDERFPEVVAAQPALLAQHCQKGGLTEQAVEYWLKAGQQALARSAMAEAAAQARKGLAILTILPNSSWGRHQELDLLMALRPALTATVGWAAAEVEETLTHARMLAEQLDRLDYLAPLIAGQWRVHLVRAEYRLSLTLSEQLEQSGEVRNHVEFATVGRFLRGATYLFLGEPATARVLLEQSMSSMDLTYQRFRELFVDPYSVILAYLAVTLGYLGYIDQAQSCLDEALSKARQLKQVYTLAQVLFLALWFERVIRSPSVHLDELLALSTEHNFSAYSDALQTGQGRLLIAVGRAQEGLVLLAQTLAKNPSGRSVMGAPILFISLAEAHAMLGQFAEAQHYLAEATQLIEATEERIAEVELLHRISGDVLKALGDRFGAERSYWQAIAIAERQDAKLPQLRASVSLARLWQGQGRRMEANNLLSPIYNWFTEGFNAPDLTDAKALLDELA